MNAQNEISTDEYADERALLESFVGRTVIRAIGIDNGGGWSEHLSAVLWFDDGRSIEFGSWGHDAWGLTVTEVELRDVEACAHCGQPHKDRYVVRQANGLGYCYCTDGNHRAWKETRADTPHEEP